jgi:hypothetical protein
LTGLKLKNLNMAVAVAGLLAAATACSFHDNFTEADLIAGLHERGLLFQLYHADSSDLKSFSGMNGLLTTNEFRWVRERLYVSHFSGRGEAVVAASRISIDGIAVRYPDDTHTGEVSVSDNIGFPVNRYQRGALIVTYAGKSVAVLEALDEVMGKPFAGDRALGDRLRLGDDFPLFKNLQREHGAAIEAPGQP